MDRKKLVNQSIDDIMQHLDEDLSLDILAAQFYIFKYHFCRILKKETGEGVYAFIKRSKIILLYLFYRIQNSHLSVIVWNLKQFSLNNIHLVNGNRFIVQQYELFCS